MLSALFAILFKHEIPLNFWRKYFPNFMFGFYDEIKENPLRFYSRICNFLEIRDFLPCDVNKTVFQGVSLDATPKL